jgi:uncharacterized protein (TIGR03067 family)
VTKSICLLVACSLTLDIADQEAATKEQARLEGVWSFALVEVDGKNQPALPFETNRLIISKDGNYVVVQGKTITRGTIKLDPAKSPKHYDVTIGTGPLKGQTSLGIYQSEGDTLKICLPLRSKDRPTELASKPGSGLMLNIFKREKKDPTEALIEVARLELAGTWQALTYALDGKKMSDEDMKNIKLQFDAAGKATVTNDGKIFIVATTKISLAGQPMGIDLTYTEGDLKGKASLGIYKIEDDLLTICRAGPDQARPTEFSSNPGSGHTLMTYKREKPGGGR